MHNLKSEYQTGFIFDQMSNADIGDIIAFSETILLLEQEEKINFTLDMDRDNDLPDLFRECMSDWQAETDGEYNYFSQFVVDWLRSKQDEKKNAYIKIFEACPHCGRDIEMEVPHHFKKIPFCPYCGEKDIVLCSLCMKRYGDCDKNNPNPFCKQKEE